MKTNNNIPSYRFQGYTDAWELRKLGEVAEINPKSQIPEKFEYVDLESVVGTSLISHRTVRAESAPSRAQRLALPGDIFYQTVRPYQKNNYLFDLSDDNYVFSTGYAQLRPKIDDRYLMIKIQDDGFVKKVLDRCTGTSYPAINSKDLSQISIDVPTSLPEQETIGTFFSTLDRQITLHQRKLDTLKEQKMTYLKLLFPAKGQTKPALRFQGFEDDWKEVKVSDIFQVTRGQVLSTNLVSDTKSDEYPYPVYSSQTKNNGLMGFYKDYLFDTAITWTTDGANAGTVRFREGKFYSTNVNGVLLSDEGYSNIAISEILNTVAWKYVSKVGNPKLMNNIMSEIILLIPGGFAEQQVLSSFFQTLDQEIAQVEDKLASLKEMKKTLLRKLFV